MQSCEIAVPISVNEITSRTHTYLLFRITLEYVECVHANFYARIITHPPPSRGVRECSQVSTPFKKVFRAFGRRNALEGERRGRGKMAWRKYSRIKENKNGEKNKIYGYIAADTRIVSRGIF